MFILRPFLPRVLRLSVVALVAVMLSGAATAQDAALQRADQLKAAYLFNFVKFVEWPNSAAGDLEICFVGASGVQESLRISTAEKRIGARGIVVRAFARGETPGHCSVLYIERAGGDEALLQSARATALTVSDADHFTASGGVIQLFTEDNRLRFVINVDNARRAGLRISSNLLKLASRVETEGAP